jgi:hypothetical protein
LSTSAPFLPDDDARPAGVDRDHHLAWLALDRDVGDRRVTEARLQILPEQLVFTEQLREIAVGVPARSPLLGDAKAKADWIDLLSH